MCSWFFCEIHINRDRFGCSVEFTSFSCELNVSESISSIYPIPSIAIAIALSLSLPLSPPPSLSPSLCLSLKDHKSFLSFTGILIDLETPDPSQTNLDLAQHYERLIQAGAKKNERALNPDAPTLEHNEMPTAEINGKRYLLLICLAH